MQTLHEVEDGESGDKMQTKVEVTREPKPRIGARETGQQTSEKKAEQWQGRELSMPKNTGVEQELRVVKSEKLVINSRVGESCDRLVHTKNTRRRLHSRSLVSLERENQGGDRAEHAGDCRVTVPTGR